MMFLSLIKFLAKLAQLIEHHICNVECIGLSPILGPNDYTHEVAESLSDIGDLYLVDALSSGVKIVCVAECEDCGTFMVTDPSFISLMKVDGTVMGVSRCSYCERAMTVDEVSLEMTNTLMTNGVKMLDWGYVA